FANCFFRQLAAGLCLSARGCLLLRRLFLLLAAGDLARRGQDHVHGISFHARPELPDALVANLRHQALQPLASPILMGHFASAEAQTGLYLVTFGQEAQHMVALGDVIMLIHVDAELNFLQDNLFLVLLRCPFLFFLFIQEFPVIHDAADWRNGGRRNLYQVKILFAGLSGCILRRHDAELLTIRANYAYLPRADALVHANITLIYASLLKRPSPQLVLEIARKSAG